MVVRSHFSSKLVAEINELREKIAHDVGMGSARDYADYRQQVGRIEGLSNALALIDKIDIEINGD